MITSAGGSGVSWVPISSGVRAKTSGVPTRRAVSRMRATKKRSRTTATTFIGWAPAARLVVLLLVAEPVAIPLGQMREGGEVPHPIEVDPAVQVIGLVLGDAGEEFLGHHVDPAALAVEGLEPHTAEARDRSPARPGLPRSDAGLHHPHASGRVESLLARQPGAGRLGGQPVPNR